MDMRLFLYVAPVFILFLSAPEPAAAQGYAGYPYTIMAPEPGASRQHRAGPPRGAARTRPEQMTRTPAGRRPNRNVTVARGSSGSVLPAPLPRTRLIPPEGSGTAAVRVAPQQPGPTVVPGLANPVPNLPHGAETFQDRASRCVMQQGLYNVPGAASTRYMGACLQ